MYKYILTIATLVFASCSCHGAVEALWGPIDAKEEKEVLMEMPDTPQKEINGKLVKEAPLVPKKTICEVLREKNDLGDSIYSQQLLDGVNYIQSTTKPEFKMLLTDSKNIQELYKAYREEYLRLKCPK